MRAPAFRGLRATLVQVAFLASAGTLGVSPPARAHWCSNIYDSGARLVIKPEQSTVFPGMNVGDSTTLRVWVRNNFPYVMTNAEMRATSSDFSVTIAPDLQNLYPWQEVPFDFQITRTQNTGDNDLRLELRVFDGTGHRDGVKVWRDETDWWVDPQPPEDALRNSMNSAGDSEQLSAARLADLYSEQDGVDRLVELYGRPRLGYNNEGIWGEGAWFPDRALYKYDYKLLRSGVELARRKSTDSRVVPAMVMNMDDPNELYRGASALLAAYLGGGSGAQARIETMATTDECVDQEICSHYSFTPSDNGRLMGKAALLVLGQNQYHAEVTAGLSSSNEWVQMICSAALGLLGEDAPVVNTLMPLARDTAEPSEDYLFGAYLLSLVAADRRGDSDMGCVAFYGEVCGDDDLAPGPPTNLQAH